VAFSININKDCAFWPVPIPGLVELVSSFSSMVGSSPFFFWVATEELPRISVGWKCHYVFIVIFYYSFTFSHRSDILISCLIFLFLLSCTFDSLLHVSETSFETGLGDKCFGSGFGDSSLDHHLEHAVIFLQITVYQKILG
jgi:hypothetical protein